MQAAGALAGRALVAADTAECCLRRLLPTCPHHLPVFLGVATLAGAYLSTATYRAIRDLIRIAHNNRKRKRKQEACRASIDELEARLAKHPVKVKYVLMVIMNWYGADGQEGNFSSFTFSYGKYFLIRL